MSNMLPASAPVVSWTYDPMGRVLTVSDTSASITGVANPPGTNGLGIAIWHNYDELNRRTESIWDSVNAQTTPTWATATFDHAYNKVNQREYQAVDDNSFWHYPPVSASSLSYTANSMNQYTAVGGTSPSYDTNGNLTGDGTFTFGYDPENRMVSATDGSVSASYAWDGRGHRKTKTVGSTTTHYVTDADNREILEYDGSTGQVLRWYVYGLGIDDALNQVELSGDRQTLIPDIQGSVIASLASTSGSLTRTGYRVFGESATTTGSYRYTGRRIDAETNGLYYYRARMYSPTLGRFLQPDPIGYEGGHNLYAYVGNDPLNNVDSEGLAPGDNYPTADAAAIAAMQDIYSQSVQQNIEYAGRIYQKWLGFGSYSYTAPNSGTVDRSNPGSVPVFTSNRGYYHSHGGPDPRYDNERFSPQDVNLSKREGQPGYLVTPSGNYRKYDPAVGRAHTIYMAFPPGTRLPDAPNSFSQSPAPSGPRRDPISTGYTDTAYRGNSTSGSSGK